tara:strand:+ start:340 stop:744 length:405 start_codon:yes stop_codon:yes gene_type:complete
VVLGLWLGGEGLSEKLSSRQLRSCGECGKRKNLEWDGWRKLCHECLVVRCDEVVRLHRENEITYHEAEHELMKRLRIDRLKAEARIHPPPEEWKHPDRQMKIKIDNQVVEWDEEGNLIMPDGRRLPVGGDGDVS